MENLENKVMDLRSILASVLKCSVTEVELIENCQYDFNMIIESIRSSSLPVTLESVCTEIYYTGVAFISDAVEKTHSAMLEEINSQEDCAVKGEKTKELEKISSLNPEEDIKLYYNSVATRISIPDDGLLDVYNEYFKDVLQQAGKDMGIEIE